MKNTSLLALVLCAGVPVLAQAPVSLNIADVATIKAGFLGQLQFQSNTDPIYQGTSEAFVLRRGRLYLGGTVGDKIEFTVDTDQPKTGAPASNVNGLQPSSSVVLVSTSGTTGTTTTSSTGISTSNSMILQDVVMTYKFCPQFVLDSGILTIDPNHDGLTGAARLFGNDTSAYASLQNTAVNTVSGNREVGVSARGLLGDHFEYHFGVTNGLRVNANDVPATATVPSAPAAAAQSTSTISSNNAMRVTIRGQYDLFDNEGAGYTVAEEYFGHKKIVSFGAGYDHQNEYKQTTGDVFIDVPVNGGDVFNFEANYWVYDGGTFLPSLLKQKDWSIQTGYLFGSTNIAPILRLEQKRYDNPGTTMNTAGVAGTNVNGNLNEDRQCIGLAYFMKEHRANFKIFYNNIKPKDLTIGTATTTPVQNSYHQITAQFQIAAW